MIDELDWNRLRSGDLRALNPDHQDVFNMVFDLQAEIEHLKQQVESRDFLLEERRLENERLRQRMQIMREEVTENYWKWFCIRHPEAAEWFDEEGIPR